MLIDLEIYWLLQPLTPLHWSWVMVAAVWAGDTWYPFPQQSLPISAWYHQGVSRLNKINNPWSAQGSSLKWVYTENLQSEAPSRCPIHPNCFISTSLSSFQISILIILSLRLSSANHTLLENTDLIQIWLLTTKVTSISAIGEPFFKSATRSLGCYCNRHQWPFEQS